MKRITVLILLIFISLTLMISIGCSIFGGSGKSTIISGGIRSGGGSGGSEGGDYPKRKIAFENLSNNRIYIVNEDGTGLHQLDPNTNTDEENAMWSPVPINGKYKIVFIEKDQLGNNRLAIINEDGTNKQILVNDNTYPYLPMWSPTGNLIAFIKVTGQANYGNLFSVALNGSQKQFTIDGNLPVEPLIINPPMWDPNSTYSNYRITFLKPNNNGFFDIYLFLSSKGQSTPLTSSGDVISFAAWSKNRDKITYVKYNNANKDIFVMDMNTGIEYQITNTSKSESFPLWSPIDNNKLLFIRNNGDQNNPNDDIFIADISNINNPQIQQIVRTPQNEVFAV